MESKNLLLDKFVEYLSTNSILGNSIDVYDIASNLTKIVEDHEQFVSIKSTVAGQIMEYINSLPQFENIDKEESKIIYNKSSYLEPFYTCFSAYLYEEQFNIEEITYRFIYDLDDQSNAPIIQRLVNNNT